MPLLRTGTGGSFTDLRERAGREVTDLGFSFCPIGAVVPAHGIIPVPGFVSVVMAAKRTLSPSVCVHLFGAGHPSMFALATAMGCDLFDSAAYALYAKRGDISPLMAVSKLMSSRISPVHALCAVRTPLKNYPLPRIVSACSRSTTCM